MRASTAVADFHQAGAITTLHRFAASDARQLERQLEVHAETLPIALVLPCLYEELHGPALARTIRVLRQVRYLDQVVVSVDGASRREQFEELLAVFRDLPTRDGKGAVAIWNEGPRVRSLFETLRAGGLEIGAPGKGRALWLACGYVLAGGRARVVAVHDCDIRNYGRELLARLCFPTVRAGFEFAKGYYGRVEERLYGRVTRLFAVPLLRSIRSLYGNLPLIDYLASFRYALAGECSMIVDLVRLNRLPADWGLEVGLLAEVFRHASPRRICQVELVESYHHRHRDLSPADPARGLHRIAGDIAASLIRNLATWGVTWDGAFVNALTCAYVRAAQDAVESYCADALLNGLCFDRHEEELAVETFSRALLAAGRDFARDPLGAPPMPSWNRVGAVHPTIFDELLEVVEDDSAPARVAVVAGARG